MAKRKRKRHYFDGGRKRRHWHRPKRIPLMTVIPAASTFFMPAHAGFATPWQCIQQGDWQGLMDSMMTGWLPGICSARGAVSFNPGALNPLDFGNGGAYWKTMLWSSIGSMLLGMTGVKRKFDNATRNIPFLKKFGL
jgi:hypothetical protein